MNNTWTPEQEALLIRIWPTGESLKRYSKELGDRQYSTIVSHAHRVLKLGSRPKSARGVPGFAWEMIADELARHPGTASDLIKRTRLTMAPVYAHLRKANPGPTGLIHVVTWHRRSSGGGPVPVYALGPGKNAPKPDPYTTSEKWHIKKARRGKKSNPFATAIGVVPVSLVGTGRVYQQSMSIRDDEEMAA